MDFILQGNKSSLLGPRKSNSSDLPALEKNNSEPVSFVPLTKEEMDFIQKGNKSSLLPPIHRNSNFQPDDTQKLSLSSRLPIKNTDEIQKVSLSGLLPEAKRKSRFEPIPENTDEFKPLTQSEIDFILFGQHTPSPSKITYNQLHEKTENLIVLMKEIGDGFGYRNKSKSRENLPELENCQTEEKIRKSDSKEINLNFYDDQEGYMGGQFVKPGMRVFDCIYSFTANRFNPKHVKGAIQKAKVKFPQGKIIAAKEFLKKEVDKMENMIGIILPDEKKKVNISYFDQKNRRKIDMHVPPLTLFPDIIDEIFKREALICCRTVNHAIKKISYIEIQNKKLSFSDCKGKYAMELPSAHIVFKNCICCFPVKCKKIGRVLAFALGITITLMHFITGVLVFFDWKNVKNEFKLPDFFELEEAKIWAVSFGCILSALLILAKE